MAVAKHREEGFHTANVCTAARVVSPLGFNVAFHPTPPDISDFGENATFPAVACALSLFFGVHLMPDMCLVRIVLLID